MPLIPLNAAQLRAKHKTDLHFYAILHWTEFELTALKWSYGNQLINERSLNQAT